jgi:ADP-dependent NAD(P)H-hydrate dehydratase / NAD(P)H-hydrate epimerase
VPGAVVEATATVTFGSPKLGLVVAPGRFRAGRVHVAPIGLAPAEHEHELVTAQILQQVPRKGRESTKYSAGTVLVVGGSPGLTGAPMLAALAAFRADAGYVMAGVPESTLPIFETGLLEAVKRPLPEDASGRLLPRAADAIVEAAERSGAVAIGPGLGRTDGTRDLVHVLLERLAQPVVLDADALYALEPVERAAPTVLTPHAGELARLLGASSRDIDAHRHGATVLLKGADTLVAAPDEGVLVVAYGDSSLATAGTGDVLTGVIAAFLSKGMDGRLAAAAGAVAHGIASRLVQPRVGLVASDLLPGIQRALAGEGWDPPL